MQFKFADRSISDSAVLDASLLPKNRGISPGKYDLTIAPSGVKSVSGQGFTPSPSDIASIGELVIVLAYASRGYTDCQMPLATFRKLVGAFSSSSGSQALDFKFPPISLSF